MRAGRSEPDHRRQPVQAHHEQRDDPEHAAPEVEAVGVQRIGAVQQLAAELADRIADAGADDEARPEQKIDRQIEIAEPADREDQIGDAGVVAQQRDDADEQRQHRQHDRRRAGLLFGDRVAGAEPEEAGQHREILVKGIHREHRCEPADQHQLQQQAEHGHQHDHPDLRPGAQRRIVGLERGSHHGDMALQRRVEPAPADQQADRNQRQRAPEHAGGLLRRVAAFELEQIGDAEDGVDGQ